MSRTGGVEQQQQQQQPQQQPGFPFPGVQQPAMSNTTSQAAPTAAVASAATMQSAMTTMQQVVSQLRSPPQAAGPGMPPTSAGPQIPTSNQHPIPPGGQMPPQGMRLQGIRVQGPPPQPGQQITRVRIQGSQAGQGQQMQVIGHQQSIAQHGPTTTTTASTTSQSATEVQIPQQSGTAAVGHPVQIAPRPRGPPGYPGNQPPRFATPGRILPCPLMVHLHQLLRGRLRSRVQLGL